MSNEKIISIKEGSFVHKNSSCKDVYEGGYDGYIVKTTNREVLVGISNNTSCCENWGYMISNDDLLEFIGAELLAVRVANDMLNTIELPPGVYEGSAIFITFITSAGDFQLAVYNEHNGYYSHKVLVKSDWLNYSCLL